MSKTIKNLMIRDYESFFDGVDNALLVSLRGISANDNNRLRLELQKKDMKVTVLRNTLARKAFAGTGLEGLEQALDGPSALAYGGTSVIDVARELMSWKKEIEKLELKAGILDGIYFGGEKGVEELSKYPTREEAIANVVTLVLSPGRKLAGAIKGPGGRLGGVLKTIEDKLEKGEELRKAG